MRARVIRPHIVATVAFFLGACLAMSFLSSLWGGSATGWLVVTFAGGVCTAIWWLSVQRAGAGALRWIGCAAWLLLLAFYALWIYLAVAFGLLLAWTLPGWLWALVAVAAIAAAVTMVRPHHRAHVPLALPLGIWIAAVLSGWLREENLVRCDDFLALRPPVELVVASDPRLASCHPGEVRPSGRFPRTIWQHPDGVRVIFTTQGAVRPGGIEGSVCEARLGDGAAPRCVGPPLNKSQGLIELPDQGRLLVMQWELESPTGTRGAVVFELPRDDDIAILAEHWFDAPLGDGFYEPRNSTLYMFSDRRDRIYRAVLPTFEPAPPIPVAFAPGELHYDPAAGEGVACGSPTGAALRGEPFALRYFADGKSSLLEKLSMTWGCDWDQAARRIYSTIPNLGLLDKINYDTGEVEKRWFVGPGMRSVEYDPKRRRVYFTNFLRGEVVAFDERSERIVDRWFVGRFSRWVRLTPDGRALLATGNLGIVRIPLPD